jgi:hypothetical protein
MLTLNRTAESVPTYDRNGNGNGQYQLTAHFASRKRRSAWAPPLSSIVIVTHDSTSAAPSLQQHHCTTIIIIMFASLYQNGLLNFVDLILMMTMINALIITDKSNVLK